MAKQKGFSTVTILSIALGVFFLVAGIYGIAGTTGTMSELERGINKLLGQSDNTAITLVISVLEIISGAIMLLAPFGVLQRGILNVAVILVFVFWGVNTGLEFFVYGEPFEPSTLAWLKGLALNLVVLLAVWQVRESD